MTTSHTGGQRRAWVYTTTRLVRHGAISGFDRLLFRGTLRRIATATELEKLLLYLKVPPKEAGDWMNQKTEQAQKASVAAAEEAGRPVLYPPLLRHGMANPGSWQVMRFPGKRVPASGALPVPFSGEVSSDIPALLAAQHADIAKLMKAA